MATSKTRVLVVDDSALIREILTEILQSAGDLEVVGTARDPYSAWEKIQRLRPDVLTLDVEMPRMDGITFLQRLMRVRPLPVLMVSSLTEAGCETTLRALELGAIDFVSKPKIDVAQGTQDLGAEIIEKVRIAAHARPRTPGSARPTSGATAGQGPRLDAQRPPRPAPLIASTHKVLALGASTGGTEALRVVLAALPADAPGTVIVQHMPETFTKGFANRLDGLCRIHVKEAQDGDRILPGQALIAPGNRHMSVVRSGAAYIVRLSDDDPVNRHRPSVDVLFDSCARALGRHAVGAIFTGMGNDGARGLLAMRDAGAATIAQDEATCVVFGMPREAIERGAAQQILPLDDIAPELLRLTS